MKGLLIRKYKNLKQSFVTINWESSWKEEKIILDNLLELKKKKKSSFINDSIFQYKAQTYNVSRLSIILLNLISIFSVVYLIVKALCNRTSRDVSLFDGGFYYSLDNICKDLKENYSLVKLDYDKFYINRRDFVYLFKLLIKLRFNLLLFSSATFRILLTSYAKKRYDIKFLLCDMEYSAAGGILRDYCNKNGIELYNYMHGEKLLTLRDSFCSFDRFYVWNEEYKNMFERLHANTVFYIYNPWSDGLLFEKSDRVNEKTVCYILKGIETIDEIEGLKVIFERLINKGYLVYVKDHPRQNEVSQNFRNVKIIDKKIPFLEIINDFDYFISQYSTVLTQCYFKNIPFFVDDISNIEIVPKLKDRGYVLSDSKYLLSCFLK